ADRLRAVQSRRVGADPLALAGADAAGGAGAPRARARADASPARPGPAPVGLAAAARGGARPRGAAARARRPPRRRRAGRRARCPAHAPASARPGEPAVRRGRGGAARPRAHARPGGARAVSAVQERETHLEPRRLRRIVVGRPMRTGQLEETLLPKTLALPIFASDPLSSVAYATESGMVVLLAAGTASLHLVFPLSIAIAALLAIVVLSYRQT